MVYLLCMWLNQLSLSTNIEVLAVAILWPLFLLILLSVGLWVIAADFIEQMKGEKEE
jgi:hypothetical protein